MSAHETAVTEVSKIGSFFPCLVSNNQSEKQKIPPSLQKGTVVLLASTRWPLPVIGPCSDTPAQAVSCRLGFIPAFHPNPSSSPKGLGSTQKSMKRSMKKHKDIKNRCGKSRETPLIFLDNISLSYSCWKEKMPVLSQPAVQATTIQIIFICWGSILTVRFYPDCFSYKFMDSEWALLTFHGEACTTNSSLLFFFLFFLNTFRLKWCWCGLIKAEMLKSSVRH